MNVKEFRKEIISLLLKNKDKLVKDSDNNLMLKIDFKTNDDYVINIENVYEDVSTIQYIGLNNDNMLVVETDSGYFCYPDDDILYNINVLSDIYSVLLMVLEPIKNNFTNGYGGKNAQTILSLCNDFFIPNDNNNITSQDVKDYLEKSNFSYVIYDPKEKDVIRFSDGNIVIYGDLDEVFGDCEGMNREIPNQHKNQMCQVVIEYNYLTNNIKYENKNV